MLAPVIGPAPRVPVSWHVDIALDDRYVHGDRIVSARSSSQGGRFLAAMLIVCMDATTRESIQAEVGITNLDDWLFLVCNPQQGVGLDASAEALGLHLLEGCEVASVRHKVPEDEDRFGTGGAATQYMRRLFQPTAGSVNLHLLPRPPATYNGMAVVAASGGSLRLRDRRAQQLRTSDVTEATPPGYRPLARSPAVSTLASSSSVGQHMMARQQDDGDESGESDDGPVVVSSDVVPTRVVPDPQLQHAKLEEAPVAAPGGEVAGPDGPYTPGPELSPLPVGMIVTLDRGRKLIVSGYSRASERSGRRYSEPFYYECTPLVGSGPRRVGPSQVTNFETRDALDQRVAQEEERRRQEAADKQAAKERKAAEKAELEARKARDLAAKEQQKAERQAAEAKKQQQRAEREKQQQRAEREKQQQRAAAEAKKAAEREAAEAQRAAVESERAIRRKAEEERQEAARKRGRSEEERQEAARAEAERVRIEKEKKAGIERAERARRESERAAQREAAEQEAERAAKLLAAAPKPRNVEKQRKSEAQPEPPVGGGPGGGGGAGSVMSAVSYAPGP